MRGSKAWSTHLAKFGARETNINGPGSLRRLGQAKKKNLFSLFVKEMPHAIYLELVFLLR